MLAFPSDSARTERKTGGKKKKNQWTVDKIDASSPAKKNSERWSEVPSQYPDLTVGPVMDEGRGRVCSPDNGVQNIKIDFSVELMRKFRPAQSLILMKLCDFFKGYKSFMHR